MKKILLILLFLLFQQSVFAYPSLDDMIGQMILVGFHGDSVQSSSYKKTKRQIENGDIGGVIIYEYNVKNPEQIKSLIFDINNSKSKYKPFIGLDQEGGIVHILGEENGFKNYLTARNVSNTKNLKQAYDMYFNLSKTLADIGFNLNFSPDVDLLINKNSIIAKKERSFSGNEKIVTNYAKEVLKSHYDNNIITSLKHFPGHGSPIGDTHKGFVDASNTWSERELYPYKMLANYNNLEMVMVSHIFIDKLDNKYPSSLSKNIIDGILRKQIGYNGVVITDDLYMGAIRENYSLEDIIINSINATCDILMFSNYDFVDTNLPKKVHKIIKKAIREGKISEDTIINSYNRIAKLKAMLEDKKSKEYMPDYDTIIKKYEGKIPVQWGENTDGVLTRIKTNEKILALTLDACGSKNDSLDEDLINFLIKEKIPATLFINGRWIKKYPDKFQKLAKNPLFEIENHGIRHCPASINGKSIYNIEGTKNVQELIQEIDENGKYIEKLTGRKPIFFRSGTAYYDEYATKVSNELGYGVIGFSILGDRGATYTKEQVTRALLKAKAGDIIICHMNHPEKQTGVGLINVLPKLKKRGFRFVKLEDYKNQLY